MLLILFCVSFFFLAAFYVWVDEQELCEDSPTGQHEFSDWKSYSSIAYKRRYCYFCGEVEVLTKKHKV